MNEPRQSGLCVGAIDNMSLGAVYHVKAELVLDERHELRDEAFAELNIWKLAAPLPGSAHSFKYSLALVIKAECVLRYDNEQGKGDHRHYRNAESGYVFTSLEQLQVDFWTDVNKEWGEP